MWRRRCLLAFSPCPLVALSFLLAFHAHAADFTLHPDQPIGPPIVGFGAQMNPYLYCTPNWGEVTEANVKEFERKVIELGPQHVRIFCLNEWFQPKATEPVSRGDPRMKASFIRTVELAQRAGATV